MPDTYKRRSYSVNAMQFDGTYNEEMLNWLPPRSEFIATGRGADPITTELHVKIGSEDKDFFVVDKDEWVVHSGESWSVLTPVQFKDMYTNDAPSQPGLT